MGRRWEQRGSEESFPRYGEAGEKPHTEQSSRGPEIQSSLRDLSRPRLLCSDRQRCSPVLAASPVHPPETTWLPATPSPLWTATTCGPCCRGQGQHCCLAEKAPQATCSSP